MTSQAEIRRFSIPTLRRAWAEHVGILNGIILAAIVSVIGIVLLPGYGLQVRSDYMDRLFAAKLTFLSMTLAVAFVLYNNFFHFRWTVGQQIKLGEFPPEVKEAKEMLKRAQRSGRTDDPMKEWIETTTESVKRSIAETKENMTAINRPLFRSSFSCLIGLIASLFASTIADVLWLISPVRISSLQTMSTATMLAAFMLFGIVLIRYVVVLRREVAAFFDY